MDFLFNISVLAACSLCAAGPSIVWESCHGSDLILCRQLPEDGVVDRLANTRRAGGILTRDQAAVA